MRTPLIPNDAPFNEDQRSWIDGFFAGLNASRFGLDHEKDANSGAVADTINILFGTQTGNAEDLANQASSIASERGLSSEVSELDSIDMKKLSQMKNAIVVVSTYGEGEMPDNANIFWENLSAETAPRLEGLSFSVLALGDTGYDDFCQAGKLIDTRLEQLGAKRVKERIDCDVDYEEIATTWLNTAIPTEQKSYENQVSQEAEVVSQKPTKVKWNKKNPFFSKVIENLKLSGDQSQKDIRHVAFDLADSDINYEAGDAVGIIPVNDTGLVTAILDRLKVNFDCSVEGFDKSIGDLLRTEFEIMTPSNDLVTEVEKQARNPELTAAINDKDSLNTFLWGKDILDLLNINSNLMLTPAKFIQLLRPLQHRAYSISSSSLAFPNQVHLTVSAVRWDYRGRLHKGVASTYLADQVSTGDLAGIFLTPNKNFRVPKDDSLPMIMVGPGTGVAPFRAFLQERQEKGATGTNWLFFGDQHKNCDFLYEREMEEMIELGVLNRLDLAFSRDQPNKVYVQDKMRENGKELFSLLEQGGHFYVCGDASKMAKDVDETLFEVVKKHGNFTMDKASEYIKNLKLDKRYVRDVY